MRKLINATAAALCTGVIAAGLVASPAQAQGLVNVYVNNVLTNNNVGVGVAANIAATVCGVTAQVGVIAQQVARTGGYSCTSNATGNSVLIQRQ